MKEILVDVAVFRSVGSLSPQGPVTVDGTPWSTDHSLNGTDLGEYIALREARRRDTGVCV